MSSRRGARVAFWRRFATQGIGFVVDGNLTIKFLSRHFFRQKIRSFGLPEPNFFWALEFSEPNKPYSDS